MDFTLSTPSVNSYGFRVLTSGIQLEGFKKNPVMFYGHNRWDMPIGRWENLRIEGDALMGTAVFDEADVLGAEAKRKVEEGFLNACSIGIQVIEMSEDPALMLPGQTRPTVTKSAIFEISVVDIPGNPDALKLSFPASGITLDGKFNESILNELLPAVNVPQPEMKNIALKLGLADTATEQEVLSTIEALQAQSAKTVPAVLAFGRSKGVITDGNAKAFEALANNDLDATLLLIQTTEVAAPAADVKLSDVVAEMRTLKTATVADPRADWTFRDWEKNDSKGLAKLRKDNPEKFDTLYNAYYQ